MPAGVAAYSDPLAEWRTAQQTRAGDLTLLVGFRDRVTGDFMDLGTAYRGAPVLPDGNTDETWVAAHYEEAALVVPGWRYPQVAAVVEAIRTAAPLATQ